MYAFDVSDPSNPSLSSVTTVGTNGWPDGNGAFATNGLVYADHSVWDNAGEYFSERNDLDVVDFTVPSSPVVRDPIDIPGALTGISRDGNVIYTVNFDGALAALAYDGVSTYLIDTLPASTNSFQESLIVGETVFTAQAASSDDTTSRLAAWTLANSGEFSLQGSLSLSQPVYAMANFGNLLGVQAGAGIDLVDITSPTRPATIGNGASSECLWLSLTGADGALGSGLWLPLGDYGVFPILAPQ